MVFLKKGTREFQNGLPFERSTCFYVTNTENFERFQYFNFETNFLENENLLKKCGTVFSRKYYHWKSITPIKIAMEPNSLFFEILLLCCFVWSAACLFTHSCCQYLVMNFIFKNCKQFTTSEDYSKTNGMGSTKSTYHKDLSFASNYFIFLKILF